MDAVLRGLITYLFVFVVFRIAGRRTLSEATTFDFVLLLIVAETTQNALIQSDQSMTNAALLIVTLVGLDILLSLLKQRLGWLERWIDGTPLVLVEDGTLHRDRMRKARIDESDILEAAHDKQGLERLDQIKYAVLERGGSISIIPRPEFR